jgi:hypothetical protein
MFEHNMSPGSAEIQVVLSSYVDEYTLTGWIQTSPDCHTENNICQEINIDSLLIQMALVGSLTREENGRYFYNSIDAEGHIKFHGKARKLWPATNQEVFDFKVRRDYQITGGPGEIVYSTEIGRVTHIDMDLPYGDSYPRIYQLTHGFGEGVDTLAIRADLPTPWVFNLPFDLYQVYNSVVDASQYHVRFYDKDDPSREVGGATADGVSQVVVEISGLETTLSMTDVAVSVSNTDGLFENDANLDSLKMGFLEKLIQSLTSLNLLYQRIS